MRHVIKDDGDWCDGLDCLIYDIETLLDGERVSHVIGFDTVEGWVDRLCANADGNIPVRPDGEPESERLYGQVTARKRA